MSRWENVLLTDAAYAQVAADQAANFEGVANGLSQLVLQAERAANVAAAVEQLLALDPLSAALSVIQGAVDDLLQDFSATDVYILPLIPTGWRALLRPYTMENMLADLNTSFSDLRDPNRPVLSSASGAYASVTLLAGANTWHDFENTIRIFGQLFSGREFSRWARFADLRVKYQDMRDYPIPRPQRYAHGTPWDWNRTNWQTAIPVVADALDRIYDILDSCRGYQRGLGSMVADAVRMLKERVAYLRELAREVADLADLILHILEVLPRCHVLWDASESGGTARYLRQLNNAGNRPNHQLVGGVTVLLGGPNPAAGFDVLRAGLGLQWDRAAQGGEQVAAAAQGGGR